MYIYIYVLYMYIYIYLYYIYIYIYICTTYIYIYVYICVCDVYTLYIVAKSDDPARPELFGPFRPASVSLGGFGHSLQALEMRISTARGRQGDGVEMR